MIEFSSPARVARVAHDIANATGDRAIRSAAYALNERYDGELPADTLVRAADILVNEHGVSSTNLRHEGALTAGLRIDVISGIAA